MVKSKDFYKSSKGSELKVRDAAVTVYQSGHSKVLTIPAHFPIKVGDTFMLMSKGKELSLKPLKSSGDKEVAKKLAKVERLSGLAPGSTKGLDNVEKLEEFLEGVYD